ncbi:glutathione S-transferase [Mycena belliarum]|uniref:Glutathione S-transferase n=1 Tax=Mycena belliarum TaxID=1033014 RepID=A0AAD6UFL6_9AGAR|nr:glutathione S-transferase [Mycena belliae]
MTQRYEVPAIAYGGPQVAPEQPSPDSIKLAKSLILVEFISDLYPESNLLPKDPVQHAKTCFFIDAVSTKFLPAYMGPLACGESFDSFWAALETLQVLLPADKTFAVGDEYTAADIVIALFLAHMEVWLTNDIGAYKAGEGTKAAQYFFKGQRFARFVKYFNAIKARDSFPATFDVDYMKEKYTAQFASLREQVQAAAVAAAA